MENFTDSARLPISTLSILIPSLSSRELMFNRLLEEISQQIKRNGLEKSVQTISLIDDGAMSIGEKRNRLMGMATNDYTVFIDDDDWIHKDYVGLVFRAIQSKPDVVGICGEISMGTPSRAIRSRKFYHVVSNKTYHNSQRGYERPPNHINPMKRNLALSCPFPDKSFGEDTDWAMELLRSGVWNRANQVYIPECIYFYRYNPNK